MAAFTFTVEPDDGTVYGHKAFDPTIGQKTTVRLGSEAIPARIIAAEVCR